LQRSLQFTVQFSTYSIYQNWHENKPKIKVDFHYYIAETETGGGEEHYDIIAKNIGNKPVTWSHAYIEEYVKPEETDSTSRPFLVKNQKYFSDSSITENDESINGKQIFSGQCTEVEYRFPGDFKPIVTPENIHDEKEVIGVFVDQIGNRYKSKPIVLV
jgi:hypothetical protein